MTTGPTEKHREEARELLPCPLCGTADLFLRDIAGWELDCRGCELSLVLVDDPSREGLVKRWNNRTSRDAEIREVLEGLKSQSVDCWCAVSHLTETTQFEESGTHEVACRTARELYNRLQPVKEGKNESKV